MTSLCDHLVGSYHYKCDESLEKRPGEGEMLAWGGGRHGGKSRKQLKVVFPSATGPLLPRLDESIMLYQMVNNFYKEIEFLDQEILALRFYCSVS